MKKISYWARNHKWPARIMIVVLFILLNYLGYETGWMLNQNGIIIPGLVLSIVVGIYLFGIAFYPAKALKEKWGSKKFYVWQKTCDFLLVASTFWMIVCVSNRFNPFPFIAEAKAIAYTHPPEDSSVKKYKSLTEFASSLKDENGKLLKWKERKKLLKEQVKAIKKSDLSKEGQAGLIVFFVLLAMGVELGILSLACNLSCSGSDGAALVVGIGGTALVIFLLVLAIRSVRKKNAGTKKQTPDAVYGQAP